MARGGYIKRFDGVSRSFNGKSRDPDIKEKRLRHDSQGSAFLSCPHFSLTGRFLPPAITTSPATACRMGLLLLKNRILSCLAEITQFLRGWSLCPPGRLCQPASSGRGTRWNHSGRQRTPEQSWRGNSHPAQRRPRRAAMGVGSGFAVGWLLFSPLARRAPGWPGLAWFDNDVGVGHR